MMLAPSEPDFLVSVMLAPSEPEFFCFCDVGSF